MPADDAVIEIVSAVDDELVAARQRLLPRLSGSASWAAAAHPRQTVGSDATFVARVGGAIAGSLPLALAP